MAIGVSPHDIYFEDVPEEILTSGNGYSKELSKILGSGLELEYRNYNNYIDSFGKESFKAGKEALILALGDSQEITSDILNLTGIYKVPIAKNDRDYITLIQENSIPSIKNILRDSLSKNEPLNQLDYVKTIDDLLRIYNFHSYLLGRSYFLINSEQQGFEKVLPEFELSAKNLFYTWNGGRFQCKSGRAGKRDYGVMLLYVILSDGSKKFLDAIEENDVDYFYKNSPHSTLKKLIVGSDSSKERSQKLINNIIESRQLTRLSPTAMLRQDKFARQEKFGNLINQLYEEKVPTDQFIA